MKSRTIALTLATILIGFFVVRFVMMRVAEAFSSVLARLKVSLSHVESLSIPELPNDAGGAEGALSRRTRQGADPVKANSNNSRSQLRGRVRFSAIRLRGCSSRHVNCPWPAIRPWKAYA